MELLRYILLFNLIPQLSARGFFNITPYDPIIEFAKKGKEKGSINIDLDKIYNNNNNLLLVGQGSHEYKASPYMGDLSLLTFNVYDENKIEKMKRIYDSVESLFQRAHPTIFALQGVREPILKRITQTTAAHYGVINTDKFQVDALKADKIFVPIFYDKEMLINISAGYFFRGGTETPYASYGHFRYKADSTGFVIINADIVSDAAETNQIQYFKIIKDMNEAEAFANIPIFILGGIGNVTPEIKKTFRLTFNNLVSNDTNSSLFLPTTVHGGVDNDDGLQRDFILLRDMDRVFRLNYARILSRLIKSAQHYPIHSILTISKNIKAEDQNKKEMKRKGITPPP